MDVSHIWGLYQKGKNHHDAVDMHGRAEKCHYFYAGDQWHGLEADGEELPFLNFIKPVGKYKISMIAQNRVAIVYSSPDNGVDEVCQALNACASLLWEQTKMDTLTWAVVKNAFITGDHYVYFMPEIEQEISLNTTPFPKLRARMIDKSNIYFADETNPEINEQEYILISQRLPLEQVRREAEKNGVAPELICADSDDSHAPGDGESREAAEKENERCTALLYMHRDKGDLEFCWATSTAIYVPMQRVAGLDAYPICGMRWEEKWGDARGLSGVEAMIPNQIEVNKIIARRSLSAKRSAFPKPVYNKTFIRNAADIESIGSTIEVEAPGNFDVRSVVGYLAPASASTDAAALQNELITVTRQLEGAGDAATGDVDPTQASGEAIKAARDQAAIPLNEQAAKYRQFLEDVGALWYKLVAVYYPQGITVGIGKDNEARKVVITREQLRALDVRVRIDISPIDPYSKLSAEVTLENLLRAKYITFEEYLELIDETSSVPKNRLKEILTKRNAQSPASKSIPQEVSTASAPQQGNAVGMTQQVAPLLRMLDTEQ